MRIYLLLLTFLALNFSAIAQTPFDWIDFNPNKKNLKFKIANDGLYRIYYRQVYAKGFPVSPQVSPTRYQIFHLGKEIPIHIHGIDDGTFDDGDYIEFYAFRMGGKLDVDCYEKPEHQPTDVSSMYSDSGVYFLTYTLEPNATGKRISSFSRAKDSTMVKENYHHELLDLQYPMRLALGPLYPTGIIDRNNRGALLSNMMPGKGHAGTLWRSLWGSFPVEAEIKDYVPTENLRPKIYTSVQGFINLDRTCNFYISNSASEPALGATPTKQWFVRNYDLKLDTIVVEGNIPFPASGDGKVYCYSKPEEDTWMSLNYVKIVYPQGFNMRGAKTKKFNLDTAYQDAAYFEIDNAPENAQIFDLTEYENARKIAYERSGNKLLFTVDGLALQNRKLRVVSEFDTLEDKIFERVVFPKINFGAYDYFIITNERFYEGGNPIKAYSEYRASVEGGSFRPLAMTFNEVCDLFYYGYYSPQALRIMSEYLLQNARPRFMFVIGKGFYNGGDDSLVPSYGLFPNSDHLFSNYMDGHGEEPAIPIGRLPALKSADVFNYLAKIKEHENVGTKAAWRKNMLFLSGGRSSEENVSFRRYTENFKNIVAGDYLGANVSIVSKTTTDYVEYINISEKVNEGTALITFFGHANLDFTDIEIGYVSNNALGYRNKGKYPMVIVNGCGSGNIFERSKFTYAEDWLLTPDRGAILFLAHSHVGFSGTLRSYTQTYLETAFANPAYINQPIGIVLQKAIADFIKKSGGKGNAVAVANAQQFILVGDPATKLVFMDKPDYTVSSSRLKIQPIDAQQSIFAKVDSFKLRIAVANLGITDVKRSQYKVKVERTLPNGTKIDYPSRWYNYVRNEDTLYFTAGTPPELRKAALGLNRFRVTVDFEDLVEESNEGNNVAVLDYNFQAEGMICVAPREYSILNGSKEVVFLAQNTNVVAGYNQYLFELDSTTRFDSPVLKKATVTDFTNPLWITDLPLTKDSTVFYWRVKHLNPGNEKDTLWANSSFILINNSPPGWSQSDMPQFSKAVLSGVKRNETARKWEFAPFSKQLSVSTSGNQSPDRDKALVTLGSDTLVNGNCINVGIFLIGINQFTGRAYSKETSLKCGNSLVAGYSSSGTLKSDLEGIDDGDWFLWVSAGFSYFSSTLNESTWTVLSSIGISKDEFYAKAADDQLPFIIFGRKGDATSGKMVGNGTLTSTIKFTEMLANKGMSGNAVSTIIGPATEWGNVFRDFRNDSSSDKWRLDIYGIDNVGREDLLLYDVKPDAYSLLGIQASSYPYLRLRADFADSLKQTPPQLKRWQVIYKEIPEGILLCDTTVARCNSNLTVNLGDSLQTGFVFRNISGSDFSQKLVVRYQFLNLSSNLTTTLYDTLENLERGKALYFKGKFATLNLLGDNRLTVFINPNAQAEQNYENNVLEMNISVRPDKVNPVLNVAFDGVHIADGDLVSAQPTISVSLKDDNQHFIRRDTLGLEMLLSACDTCTAQRLSFAGENVKWFANENNNFRIEYRPERALPDGEYLLKIDAEDVSGNKAGQKPYSVRFKVVNKPSFTNFYPYPNPFSSSMRFVFTLTGTSVPDEVLIRIMTVTGKVVREISRNELGHIKIGNNISEFAWDGRDQFGDQLANGVYLYKVYIRDRELNFEKSETSGDKYFKNDIGKIYLMR